MWLPGPPYRGQASSYAVDLFRAAKQKGGPLSRWQNLRRCVSQWRTARLVKTSGWFCSRHNARRHRESQVRYRDQHRIFWFGWQELVAVATSTNMDPLASIMNGCMG